MAKAVNYALTHMPKLARYVNDGRFRPDNNDIEEAIRPMKVDLNNYGYCHNHDAAYRAAMIYSFIATCNKADVNPREWMEDVMPRMKGVAPDDIATMERLLPGEWKKSHPESHSMVHHTTEEEHVAAILKIKVKEKGHRRGCFQRGLKVISELRQLYLTSSNFTELRKTWQTSPSCAK